MFLWGKMAGRDKKMKQGSNRATMKEMDGWTEGKNEGLKRRKERGRGKKNRQRKYM